MEASTLEEAYEHTEAYYDTERNRPYMATKSTMPKKPYEPIKQDPILPQTSVALNGRYSLEYLKSMIKSMEEYNASLAAVQCSTKEEQNEEEKLVEQASIPQQPKG